MVVADQVVGCHRWCGLWVVAVMLVVVALTSPLVRRGDGGPMMVVDQVVGCHR